MLISLCITQWLLYNKTMAKAGTWKFSNKSNGAFCEIKVTDTTDSKVREAFAKAMEILEAHTENELIAYDITGRVVPFVGLSAQKQQKNENKEETTKPKRSRGGK